MSYGYDPHRGTEQFCDCELPMDRTAPITYWLRDITGMNFVDALLPDGHVIRSVTIGTLVNPRYDGYKILPDLDDDGKDA